MPSVPVPSENTHLSFGVCWKKSFFTCGPNAIRMSASGASFSASSRVETVVIVQLGMARLEIFFVAGARRLGMGEEDEDVHGELG